jgi:hypothetical protein
MICKAYLSSVAVRLFTVLAFLIGCTVFTSAQSVCLQQGQSKTFNYTSSFGAAGSAKATFTLMNHVLKVEYKNTSTSNTYLSGIGFTAVNRILPENLASATVTNGWTAVAGPGGGLGNYDLIAYGNGRNRLSPDMWGTAVFILTSPRQEICFDSNIVHLTSLPNGNSEKPTGVPTTTGPGEGGGDPTVVIEF